MLCRLPSHGTQMKLGRLCDGIVKATLALLCMFYLAEAKQSTLDASNWRKLKLIAHEICVKIDETSSLTFTVDVRMAPFETAQYMAECTVERFGELQSYANSCVRTRANSCVRTRASELVRPKKVEAAACKRADSTRVRALGKHMRRANSQVHQRRRRSNRGEQTQAAEREGPHQRLRL